MHKTAAPWEELREKYEAGGYTYMQLAKEYGVSVQTVGRHARKENWVSGCRNERRRRAESRNCLLEMTRALMRGAKRAAEEAEKGEACTKRGYCRRWRGWRRNWAAGPRRRRCRC